MNTPTQREATASQFATDRPAFEARLSAGLEETHSATHPAGDQAMSLVNIAKVKYIPDFERSIQAGRLDKALVALELGMEYFRKAMEVLK